MVADVMSADVYVRQRALEKLDVFIRRAAESGAVMVGRIARIQRAQQCNVLPIDAARIQQHELADLVFREQSLERAAPGTQIHRTLTAHLMRPPGTEDE